MVSKSIIALEVFSYKVQNTVTQGNPTPQKQLPEKVSVFSETIPPTMAKQFGSRLQSPNAREILRLEMSTCYKKRKSDLGNYYS